MDSSRYNRRSLQPHNIEHENVTKAQKSLMDYFEIGEPENKKKKLVSCTTQVNLEAWEPMDIDMASKVPTDTYWQDLAEKNRVALQNALKENERLWLLHDSLKKENIHTLKMLDEVNTFIQVFKEEVRDLDDTGIDFD